MCTGVVSSVRSLLEGKRSALLIALAYKRRSLEEGASIACDGCCLTIVGIGKAKGKGSVFAVEPSRETLAPTTLDTWQEGRRINLERALSFGDELGGHLLTGHVDGRAKIVGREPDGDSARFLIESPRALAPFIAAKGSVALNGVSLTVNDVDGARFGVNIIPYTLAHTTWGDLGPGDLVNLEVDLLARYDARLRETEGASRESG